MSVALTRQAGASQKPKLLDQVSEAIRRKHYSKRIDQVRLSAQRPTGERR
jgi:hypothetical protein